MRQILLFTVLALSIWACKKEPQNLLLEKQNHQDKDTLMLGDSIIFSAKYDGTVTCFEWFTMGKVEESTANKTNYFSYKFPEKGFYRFYVKASNCTRICTGVCGRKDSNIIDIVVE
jgi:hypothetical protein